MYTIYTPHVDILLSRKRTLQRNNKYILIPYTCYRNVYRFISCSVYYREPIGHKSACTAYIIYNDNNNDMERAAGSWRRRRRRSCRYFSRSLIRNGFFRPLSYVRHEVYATRLGGGKKLLARWTLTHIHNIYIYIYIHCPFGTHTHTPKHTDGWPRRLLYTACVLCIYTSSLYYIMYTRVCTLFYISSGSSGNNNNNNSNNNIIVYRFERARDRCRRIFTAMWSSSSLPQTFMGVVKPQFPGPEGL